MGIDEETAREVLGIGHSVGCPIKGVTAVVDRAAAFGCIMDRAQELPLARTHFRAGRGAAGRLIKQKTDNKVVALRDQKAAKLIQPDRLVDMSRGCCKNFGCLARNRCCVTGRMMPMEGCQMLLELEG